MPNVVRIDLDKLGLKKGASFGMFNLAADLEAAGEVAQRNGKCAD